MVKKLHQRLEEVNKKKSFWKIVELFFKNNKEDLNRKRILLERNTPLFKWQLYKLKLDIEREINNRNKEYNPYSELYLLPNAPLEVIEAVFKQLSKMYHPDKGGDNSIMQRITNAYNIIKKERLKNINLK